MTMPATMNVIAIDGHGGPEVLKSQTRPTPRPAPGEILIEIHAAGVNRPDVIQRLGAYPAPKGAPDWPGLEVAGTVAAIGEGVASFREGDAVVALLPGGGYAEFALAPEGSVLPLPAGLDFIHGAAMPETFFTVWHNVFQRGRLVAGETFLVHGGTSGIGTTAIQLAKAFGAIVATTVGSAAKAQAARQLGADLAIDYRNGDFVEALKGWQDGRGIDLTLDMVGGDYVGRNVRVAAPDGRIVQIAHLKGKDVQFDVNLLMVKRLTLTGSTLRARDTAFKASVAAQLRDKVWPLVADGRLRPLIDTVYPLSHAADAHRHMDEDHVGKIVLVPDGKFLPS